MIELACRDVAFHGQAPTYVRATQSGPRRASTPRLTPHDRLGCNVSNSAPVNASPSVAKSPGRRYIPGISQDRAAVEAVMVRNLSFRWLLTLILTLNVAAGPTMLSAQQPPEEVPSITIRTNTRLVLVDVVVTDKKGQPITGLKPENFTVEENGKKQKISSFVAPGSQNGPAPQPVPPGIL